MMDGFHYAGLSTVIAPVYLSEVAPINLRGAAGTINQFAIVLAILISEILGLDNVMGNSALWPYLLGMYGFILHCRMCMHYLRGPFAPSDGDGVHGLEWTLYPFLSDVPYR